MSIETARIRKLLAVLQYAYRGAAKNYYVEELDKIDEKLKALNCQLEIANKALIEIAWRSNPEETPERFLAREALKKLESHGGIGAAPHL